jgi:transcription elongation factor Elf1
VTSSGTKGGNEPPVDRADGGLNELSEDELAALSRREFDRRRRIVAHQQEIQPDAIDVEQPGWERGDAERSAELSADGEADPSLVYSETTEHRTPDDGEEDAGEPCFPACTTKVRTLFCTNCGYRHPVPVTCGRRTCPDCARRRYYEIKEKYEPLQEHLREPKFVTLTLKRYPIDHPKNDLEELVDRAVEGLKKLRRRKLTRYVRGGFYAIEVKPPEPERDLGWYVHIHALWDGPRIPQEALSEAWEEITGDSFRVDIRECRKPESAVSYVLGYTTAGPKIEKDWAGVDKETRDTFEEAVKGRRLLQTFGHLHGKQAMDTEFSCPNCSQSAWVVLDLNPSLARRVGLPQSWLTMEQDEIFASRFDLVSRASIR